MNAKSKKNLVQRALIALLALGSTGTVLTSCSDKKDDTMTVTNANISSVKQALESRDSMIQSLVFTFDKVDANLEIIREKETQLREWGANEEILGNRQERIVRDIQVINTLMANNREEIAALRERIRKSGLNTKALEARLQNMEIANNEKTAELEALKLELVSTKTSLAALNDTLSQKSLRMAMQDEVITTQSGVMKDQDMKLHEAYIATGSYKELKERGLVDKKGALLGVIGGDKAFTAKTDPAEFAKIDQRDQLRIPVASKKVDLITPHPVGSYKLDMDEEGEVTAIEITNPDEFWQSSRYLIVATK